MYMYELRVNDKKQHAAKPSQMKTLPRLSTSATNAGQAKTTIDVAYLSLRMGRAKSNARAIAHHRVTKKIASTGCQHLSCMAWRRRSAASDKVRSTHRESNAQTRSAV